MAWVIETKLKYICIGMYTIKLLNPFAGNSEYVCAYVQYALATIASVIANVIVVTIQSVFMLACMFV